MIKSTSISLLAFLATDVVELIGTNETFSSMRRTSVVVNQDTSALSARTGLNKKEHSRFILTLNIRRKQKALQDTILPLNIRRKHKGDQDTNLTLNIRRKHKGNSSLLKCF
uniref:Secreted protein n=1 Tax=Cacopsylla melanoneura TaxID=428564 RepID=A0A8D9AXN6_9HEMI